MEVLARRRCDAEGLFDQAIGLVLVALGAVIVGLLVAAAASRVRCSAGAFRRVEGGKALPLALHLSVRQEAARHPAGAPGLAVGPSPHAGLALVPHKDRAGANQLPLLLGESPLHARQQSGSACLEQFDSVGRCPDMAVVSLHGIHSVPVRFRPTAKMGAITTFRWRCGDNADF